MTAAHLCIIYISEALNPYIIQQLTSLAAVEGKVALAHSFRDLAYNRTSFYLLSRGPEFIEPALNLCSYALDRYVGMLALNVFTMNSFDFFLMLN